MYTFLGTGLWVYWVAVRPECLPCALVPRECSWHCWVMSNSLCSIIFDCRCTSLLLLPLWEWTGNGCLSPSRQLGRLEEINLVHLYVYRVPVIDLLKVTAAAFHLIADEHCTRTDMRFVVTAVCVVMSWERQERLTTLWTGLYAWDVLQKHTTEM